MSTGWVVAIGAAIWALWFGLGMAIAIVGTRKRWPIMPEHRCTVSHTDVTRFL